MDELKELIKKKIKLCADNITNSVTREALDHGASAVEHLTRALLNLNQCK